MKSKCYQCNGTGEIEVGAAPQLPPCLECNKTKLRLEMDVGWFCVSCNSGPYIIDVDCLIKK